MVGTSPAAAQCPSPSAAVLSPRWHPPNNKEKVSYVRMATQTKGRVPNWREDGDQVLVDILVEHKVQHDGFVNGTFTKEAWRLALRQFNDKTHLSYTLSNLKNRFKNLKKWYAMYVNLKSRSDWGWDDERNMPVPPSEDAWDEMIAINKDYKTLKGKSFNFMDQMHIITATSMARGDLGAGDLGNSYLDQRDEPNMDDDDLFLDMNENDGDSNPPDNQQPTLTEDIPPQTTDHAPTPNSTPHNTAIVAQTSSRKKRCFSDSCNDSLEKIAKLGEERLSLQKEALELQKSVAPPVSYALDQLMKVDGIPDHLLYKAIDVMKGLDDRCIFLGLPVSLGLMDLNTAPTGQFLQIFMDEEDYWQEVDETLIFLHSTPISSPAPGHEWFLCYGYYKDTMVSTLYLVILSRKSSCMASPLEVVDTKDKCIICECGVGWCITRVSHTSANPQRPYYYCPLLVSSVITQFTTIRLWAYITYDSFQAKSGNPCKFFMWVDEVLQCPCGKGHCRKRTSKTSNSYGRSFYICPQSTADDHGLGCDFFQWVSDKSWGLQVGGEERGKHSVHEIQTLLEKEMFAAESKKELCERLLDSFKKLKILHPHIGRGKSWNGNQPESRLPPNRNPRGLVHVQVLRARSTGQGPVEAMQEVGERQLNSTDGKVDSRAQPPPRTEGDKLEIVSSEIRLAVQESLRSELLRRLPACRIPGDSPDVDEDHRLPGDVVALHSGVLHGFPGKQKRCWGVETQDLLGHRSQVAHPGDVVLRGYGLSSGDLHDLPLSSLHGPRVPDEFRHRPFEDRVRCVCSSSYQVLEDEQILRV
ncbi:hypothetical protein Taro_029083 [Colocasia esculenta]|uniref:GRF-type domain-containing protein n=1 Tax=Colocasia esculenta TaxID=4460 RepID=A0A843VKA4_COLES|nr:hypothetical protein [Colocasia esculenta]